MTVKSPTHFQALPPERSRKAEYAFFWLRRPITNSEMKIGRHIRNERMIYTMMKAAPPFSPTRYGNLHRFPRPTADPAIATRAPKRLPKLSLFIFITFLYILQIQMYSLFQGRSSSQNGFLLSRLLGQSAGRMYLHLL